MIKSKERISEFGEVFTSEREVNAMLDLVGDEAERIESRFLESACGSGNFLIEVLNRKIAIVAARYRSSQPDFERYLFLAVTSMYGVDIQLDNIEECRHRLLVLVESSHKKYFRAPRKGFLESIGFVLSRNILHGDALSMTVPGSDEAIVFSEWSFTRGSYVKRIEYTLANLLLYQPFEDGGLFSDLGSEAILPHPLKSHPARKFLEISDE
ncbi:hypothetical protein N9V47_08045 [Luminiphilus sp.]|nr:hypothetical protein [Luminiphilus sp.]